MSTDYHNQRLKDTAIRPIYKPKHAQVIYGEKAFLENHIKTQSTQQFERPHRI